jgi:hypothetical protein
MSTARRPEERGETLGAIRTEYQECLHARTDATPSGNFHSFCWWHSEGGTRMTVLHPLLHRRWLILATVGLAVVVGLIVYGSRSAALPTPEQLCRERLGLRRQMADSAAGATLLGACINDVTHARSSPLRTPGR